MVVARLLQILPAPLGAMEEEGKKRRDPKLLLLLLGLLSRCILVRQRDMTSEFIMMGSINLSVYFFSKCGEIP